MSLRMKWDWLVSQHRPAKVTNRFKLSASTVRAIDERFLERWAQAPKRSRVKQLGVDEIYLGKRQKFLTVASDLETAGPLCFAAERKK